MKFLYNYNNNNISVFLDSTEEGSEIVARFHNKVFETSVEEDSDGKYFIFKENKVYLNELKPITFEYLLRRINRGKNIFPLDLNQALKNVGSVEAKYDFEHKGEIKIVYLGYDPYEKCDQYLLEGDLWRTLNDENKIGQTVKDHTLTYMLNTGIIQVV